MRNLGSKSTKRNGRSQNPVKILIADDSIVSRRLLEATLRKWGYEVMVACDGAEAMKLLERPDAPGLIILDWMMPGVTGLEVCRRIRQRDSEPYTYILLLTSKSQKEDLIEGMEAGADDYITKPFDQNELQVRLRAGTRLMELQSQLLSAREALREQAERDFLTSLWNRSSILNQLGRELARSMRESQPLGVVVVDLDHFKQINDTLGHFGGDAVLREASRRLRSGIRQYDSVGRYGGEEFLILLPSCDEASCYAQADRLRKQLAQTPISVNDVPYRVTASFGVTTALPGQCCTQEGLIRKADEALYVAKRSGRNRTEILPYASDAAAVNPPPETAVVIP
ncbi:MAG: diguanylate cyclase [Bryobacterales bacterium]|nr:diguanylate cyclase [Bryobacterales bacterium]